MEQSKKIKLHSKKKTGWVNVYKDYDDILSIGDVHDTEEARSIINHLLT